MGKNELRWNLGKNELRWNLEVCINNRFDGAITLSFENVRKNNCTQDCVMVNRKGSKISPIVLFDTLVDMYNSCASIDDIVDYLVNLTLCEPDDKKFEAPDLEDKTTYDHLRVVMISTGHNEEFLETIPYIRVPDTDLVAILKYQYRIDDDYNYMTTVTNHVLEKSKGATAAKLFEAAFQNLNRDRILLRSMNEVLRDVGIDTDDLESEDDMPLYMLCNADAKTYGAAIMLKIGCLEYVRNVVGDFYILPSSVHELMIIPKYANLQPSTTEMLRMVRDINRTSVDPIDQLSDNIYEYDGELKMITEEDETL